MAAIVILRHEESYIVVRLIILPRGFFVPQKDSNSLVAAIGFQICA